MNYTALNKIVFSSKTIICNQSRWLNRIIQNDFYFLDDIIEIKYEEMNELNAGFFIGLTASASTATFIYNKLNSVVNSFISRRGKSTGALSSLIAATSLTTFTAVVSAYITAAWTLITAFLAANPISYGIAIAAGAIASSLIAGCIYSGAQGKGYRLGLEIGWFSIKTVSELI